MKIRLLGIFLVCLLAMGCIQSSTVIKVEPDGSGTVEETMMMNKEVLQQMKAMMAFGQQEGQDASELDFFKEDELKAKASEMGEGVTYVSSEKLSTDTKEGVKAVYSFKDITKLRFNPSPEDSMPSGPEGMGMPKNEPDKDEGFYTFQFSKGNPSNLVIVAPKKESSPDETPNEMPEDMDEDISDMKLEMMKGMFKDMKVTFAVEVDGKIMDTNATYRDGSKVTLMEMDFSQLVSNIDKFKEFAKKQPESISDVQEIMKDIEGIKVEMNEKVEIKFN